jgi:hypothetical protein
MIKLEKRSFILGVLALSVVCGLCKAALFCSGLQIASSADLAACLFIPLLGYVSYMLISKNWTNRLAHEMYRESLKSKISELKEGVDERSMEVLDLFIPMPCSIFAYSSEED